MTLVALDSSKLIFLMIAGGAFALAGLWLMLRPKPDSGAAKLELFGLKFEAGSAGLLVFLIGAVFLAIPIIVPERPATVQDTGGATATATTVSGSGQPATIPTKPGRVISIEADEAEPNDTFASPNIVQLGSVVRGTLRNDDVDHFSVRIPEGIEGDIVVTVTARDKMLLFSLFDDAGASVSNGSVTSDSSATIRAEIKRPEYTVTVRNYDDDTSSSYHLTIGAQQD